MHNLCVSLVHPAPNPFTRNAAKALQEAGLLRSIISTAIYSSEGVLSRVARIMPPTVKISVEDQLLRRAWLMPKETTIITHPSKEILRIVFNSLGLDRIFALKRRLFVDWVYSDLDKYVARKQLEDIKAIYAYEDGACTTFTEAKRRGIKCLYDLPIAYFQKGIEIMRKEAMLFPDLIDDIQLLREPESKLTRKENEVRLADHIFVASTFTKNSLTEANISHDKITVIPYGAPVDYFSPKPKQDTTFRALFAGTLCVRKGVHYLLKAWQQLKFKNSELLLVGAKTLPVDWLKQYRSIIKHIPSVPHQLLSDYYTSADVVVFPSLLEGYGLVILEAMACGIPVITTPHTAGPDVIEDGVDGFIIPIRDVDALKDKLQWCKNNRKKLKDMGYAARKKAETMQWSIYREKLASSVKDILNR